MCPNHCRVSTCTPGTVLVMLLYMKMYPFVRIVNVLMRKNCVMIVSSLSSTSVCVWLFVCQLNKW